MNIQTLEFHAGDQGLSAVNELARNSDKVYPPPAPSQMEGGVMQTLNNIPVVLEDIHQPSFWRAMTSHLLF